MTIDRSGGWWRGTAASDLDEYLARFTESAEYPVGRIDHTIDPNALMS